MPETILVTGATGTVGREVVKQLASSGATVRAGARSFSDADAGAGSARCLSFDFDRPATLERLLSGVDRVFLSTPLDERMTERSALFVDKAKAAGVHQVVRLSAMGVDFEPPILLGQVHGEVEKYIEASGLAWTMLRPNSFMQNFITYFGDSIRGESAFYVPQGEGRVSLIDVRDIAAVAVRALLSTEHDGMAYDLTGAEALSNGEVAGVLSEVTGRPIRYVDVPEAAARVALRDQGMSPWLLEIVDELHRISRDGLAAAVSPSVSEVLNRAPTSFRDFASDHARHFR